MRRRVVGLCLLIALLGVAGTILFSEPIEPPGSPPRSAKLTDPGEIQLKEEEEASSFVPRPHHDSGGGSAQFMYPDGYDNSIQLFGEESSEAEFRQAAAVLHGYLDARVAGNWAAACQYLASAFADMYLTTPTPLEEGTGLGCAASLWYRFHEIPTEILEAEAEVDVGSLRVEGSQGYLLFLGSGGTHRQVGLSNEDGRWLLTTSDLGSL